MAIISNPLTSENLARSAHNQLKWPWTEQIQPLPERISDGSEWPRISIVTPSYNQGQFIEETIRSVLLQGYPNLEYIIIDGGSNDNSVAIIKKYEQYLSYWVSEPDKGPTDAINKGWQKASGEIVAYLNSDDAYLPGTLFTIAETFQQHQEAIAICGNELKTNAEGFIIEESIINKVDHLSLLNLNFIPQPAIFIKKNILDLVGGLDLKVKYTFDFELWLRVTRLDSIKCIPNLLAVTRWHNDTITLTRRSEIGSELVHVITNEIATYPSELRQDDKKQILLNVNRLALILHLENKKIISSLKYAVAILSLYSSYRGIITIIAQYYRSLLKPLIFINTNTLFPNMTEEVHWSARANLVPSKDNLKI